MSEYLDKTGLAYFWNKVKALIDGKADTSHSHSAATAAADGFMSASDKSKLDGIAEGTELALPIAAAESTDGVTYTATVPNMTELETGKTITIIPNLTSASTTPKLNVNALGEKNIRMQWALMTSATSAFPNENSIQSGYPITLMYNGSAWVLNTNRAESQSFIGSLSIAKGGTGGITAEAARTNLEITPANIGAVAITGDETIAGVKTFSDGVVAGDTSTRYIGLTVENSSSGTGTIEAGSPDNPGQLAIGGESLTYNGSKVWDEGNDGSGSGLDADLLDGQHASAFEPAITGGATTITGSNLTASRALVSNASGKVAVSAVTSTELGYLDGVTSAIQTQLNGKSGTDHTHSGYAASSHNHSAANITSGTLPIARGGTGTANLKICYGTKSISFYASTSSSASVTFGHTYTSKPAVVTSQIFDSNNVIVRDDNITTTGFTATIPAIGSNGSRTFQWIAIGV